MAQLYWPFDPSLINYGFGYPPGYGGFHNGIDFPVPQGTPLRATVSGRIRNNDAGKTDGAGVDISTPDGWMVRMWHVSQFLVPNGSQVSAGDVVALSGGQRGTWGAGNATGPHLHWGTMVGGNWVDPLSLGPIQFGANPQPQNKGEENMKIIRSEGGRVALVGEFVVVEYTNDKDKSWSGGVNTKAFGEAKNLSNDEFQALINQATERRLSLIRELKK